MPLNASIRKGKERKFSNVDLFSWIKSPER
jgi:hypothetical protein